LDTVFEAVKKTCEQGISFYFVHGNHDMADGRRILERLTTEHEECIHLSTEATSLAGREIALTGYGIDHTGTEVSPLAPDSQFKTVGSLVVLVFHDTPFPIVDDQKKTIYRQEQLNLQNFLEASTVMPDLIIAGHMHVGSEGTVLDTEVPVVTTGPTARISDSTADNEPSTWRLTVSDSDIGVDRQPLKSYTD
jgi:DNA repair exonuclease SbcCD nuclease subunit